MKLLKNVRTVSVMLAVGLFAQNVFATAQRPNIIFFEGQKYSLCSDPMEVYFKKFPERLPKSDGRYSDLWHGYLATFDIDAGFLRLKDIETHRYKNLPDGKLSGDFPSVLKEAVPGNQKTDDRLGHGTSGHSNSAISTSGLRRIRL